VSGRIRVPGDKSISHRAIMLGAIADGTSDISGFLEGEDCLATLEAFRSMGVGIERRGVGSVRIHGVGLSGLGRPAGPLNLGNAGTGMRLLTGLLAGQAFDCVVVGDASLSSRPMKRVIDPLTRMGARIDSRDGCAPLTIRGGRRLSGVRYRMPMASAQVKSCLLLAGLYAHGQTCVQEPAPTRDHTERMLRSLGVEVTEDDGWICLHGGQTLRALDMDVPADISSAAFFMVAASITPGSDVLLEHVGMNPTRTGVVDILRLMGADITLESRRMVGNEPVADLRVRHAPLRGVHIPRGLVPLAIDEFPVLFIAAACAEGETVLTGAEELRVKESDRIQAMADGLTALGVAASPTDDGIAIRGGVMGGGRVDSRGDHRIAMAFSVAGLMARDPIDIENCANVATSFPGFRTLASGAGFRLHAEGGASE